MVHVRQGLRKYKYKDKHKDKYTDEYKDKDGSREKIMKGNCANSDLKCTPRAT